MGSTLGITDQDFLDSIIYDPLAPAALVVDAKNIRRMNSFSAFDSFCHRMALRWPNFKVRPLSQLNIPRQQPSVLKTQGSGPDLPYLKKHGVKTASSATSSSKQSFVLHKKGTIPPMHPSYGVETHTVKQAVAGKWEGLDEIVNDATQRSTTGWDDIAEIDEGTGQPVGGWKSYLDTSKPEEYDDMGVPNEIPTRTVGVDNMAIPKPYDPWKRTRRKAYVIKKKGSKVARSMSPTDAERWNTIMMDWSGLQAQWNKSLSAQNTQMHSLTESAASIAYSNRFRLAKDLSRFKTAGERAEFLKAARITPDAGAGIDIMNMADLIAGRDQGVDFTEIGQLAERLNWKQNFPYTHQNLRNSYFGKGTALNVNSYNQLLSWAEPLSGKDFYNKAKGEYWPQAGFVKWNTTGGDNLGFNWDNFYGYGTPEQSWHFHQDYVDGDNKWSDFAEKFIPRLKDAGEALKTFTTYVSKASPFLEQIAGISNEWQKEFNKQANGIYQDASYFVPKPLKEASSRLFQAHLLAINSDWTRFGGNVSMASQLTGALGGALTDGAIGFGWGGPAGAIIGGIGGALPGIIDAIGTRGKTNIKSTGEDIRSRINLWSGVAELVITPFRLLGQVARSLWGHFHRLSLSLVNIVSKFNELGLPLTMLTGVTYGDMQRSYRTDSMIGARAGTTNGTYNSFSGAQMDLYTLGQMDETRLVSAAMLGVFGDAYAYGGDTKSQYAHMANTIYSQLQGASPREQQRIMNLAGKIDNTLPARLQQMKNLGISDYNVINNDSWLFGSSWMKQYTASTEQRARYTKAGMQYTALSESIGESKNVIAERLWSTIGLPLMGTVNEILHQLAETGNWRGALEAAKKGIKDLWSNIAKQFELPENFGDFAKDAIKKVGNLLWEIVPTASKVVAEVTGLILDGWVAIATALQPTINQLVTELGGVHFSIDKKKLLSGDIGGAFSIRTPGSVARDIDAAIEAGQWSEVQRMEGSARDDYIARLKATNLLGLDKVKDLDLTNNKHAGWYHYYLGNPDYINEGILTKEDMEHFAESAALVREQAISTITNLGQSAYNNHKMTIEFTSDGKVGARTTVDENGNTKTTIIDSSKYRYLNGMMQVLEEKIGG